MPPQLAAYRLPSTTALASREVELELLGSGRVRCSFADERTVAWSAEGVPWASHGTDPYDAVEVADGAYFVDIDVADPPRDALTLALLDRTGWALAVHQRRVVNEAEPWSRGPDVQQSFVAGRIVGAAQVGPWPAPSRDMVGRRHLYRYGPENLYEHVYLSSRKFCSHNVHTQGTPGRADCHPVTHIKLDDDLYLVAWREMDSAAGMVFVENLRDCRSTGKALHPVSREQSINVHVGGHIVVLQGKVEYPDGMEPT